MNILVLADNYVPEIVATSFRTHEHAKVWQQQGHDVTVVTCAPNWPHGRLFPGYRNRLFQEERIDGIRVLRVWSYMTANQGFWRRSLDYASYMASVCAQVWRLPPFDVLLATSPQFFTAVAGWAVARLRRRPWIFEIRDLWPASIAAVGASRGRVLRRLEQMELGLYRRATRIVALTHSFREDLVQRGITADKIDVVTNGVDLQHFSPAKGHPAEARRHWGIAPDAFVVGYIGTTGMAHGLETLVEAAAACRHRPEVQFVVMGEGAQRAPLERFAARCGAGNVRFFDRVPHAEVPHYLAALDLAVIHLRPDPVFRGVIPSKLFEFMAMQVPVLLAVEGEAAGIVQRAGCGWCIEPGNPQRMAAAILDAAGNRETLRAVGARGRPAVVQHYSRRVKALEVLASLEMAYRQFPGTGHAVPRPERQTMDRPARAA